MNVVYDAGVLIAADRNNRDVWADHRARLEMGILPLTTAPVAAQVSRSPSQASLHRLLEGCRMVGFEPDSAAQVGALLKSSGLSDVVDAHVVITAAMTGGIVVTSDVSDLSVLASYAGSGSQVSIVAV